MNEKDISQKPFHIFFEKALWQSLEKSFWNMFRRASLVNSDNIRVAVCTMQQAILLKQTQ